MAYIQEIITEYKRMRANGLDAKSTLQTLRPYIEPLADEDRHAIIDWVRQWEQEQGRPLRDSQDEPPRKRRPAIKPIKPIQSAPPQQEEATPPLTCSQCGKDNSGDAVFCYSCGNLLENARGRFDTKHFEETGGLYTDDYFGPTSSLILELRTTGHYFELQPQEYDHELIAGRSTANSAMIPEIDLVDYRGEEMGVSRLHLSILYHPEDEVLQVMDLGSANGSYINGQKLHPKEIRILRHADELRLGRLVIRVHYRHHMD